MTKQLALFAMMMIGAASAAKADDTGFASIHDWRNEPGRRVCMSDHFHDGSGTGQTQKEAEAAARSSWASFTILEYGTDWGSYALSASQKMDCNSSAGTWSCQTSARPCKKAGGSLMVRHHRRSHSTDR